MIEQIKRYLSDNLDKYSYEALHAQLLKAGYPEEDIVEAKEELDLEMGKKHEDVMLFPSPHDDYSKDKARINDKANQNNQVNLNNQNDDSQSNQNYQNNESNQSTLTNQSNYNQTIEANQSNFTNQTNDNLDYLKDDNSDTDFQQSDIKRNTIDPESSHFMNPLIVILLNIITLGVYVPFWFKRQSKALLENEKDSPNNVLISVQMILSLMFITMLTISIVVFYVNPVLGVSVIGVFDMLVNIIILVIIIVSLMVAFDLRRLLAEEYNIPKPNAILTFLFCNMYLQTVINSELEGIEIKN